jgi:hypothetical protein
MLRAGNRTLHGLLNSSDVLRSNRETYRSQHTHGRQRSSVLDLQPATLTEVGRLPASFSDASVITDGATLTSTLI